MNIRMSAKLAITSSSRGLHMQTDVKRSKSSKAEAYTRTEWTQHQPTIRNTQQEFILQTLYLLQRAKQKLRYCYPPTPKNTVVLYSGKFGEVSNLANWRVCGKSPN